jgi:hypothetical protein
MDRKDLAWFLISIITLISGFGLGIALQQLL